MVGAGASKPRALPHPPTALQRMMLSIVHNPKGVKMML